MTSIERELVFDLSMAVLSLLDPSDASANTLTHRERARVIARRLQELHDDDLRQQLEADLKEACPTCGGPLNGSFPECASCQQVSALKGEVRCLDCGAMVPEGAPCYACGLGKE